MQFLLPFYYVRGPGYDSRHSDSLRAGRAEIEYRRGREFPYPSRLTLGPRSLLHNEDRVLFLGVSQPGRDVGHPTPFRSQIKERVQLYVYSSFWSS
jgi:hypothetical protein